MKSKIHLNLLFLGVLLPVLVAGGCGQPKTSSGPANSPAVAVSNHLAAVAAAGDPVTLDQLSRMYEEPPAAQNAAPIYAQAFERGMGRLGTRLAVGLPSAKQPGNRPVVVASPRDGIRFPCVGVRHGHLRVVRRLTNRRIVRLDAAREVALAVQFVIGVCWICRCGLGAGMVEMDGERDGR